MKPAEVPLQAEPTPSRTRADACHAPCHRSQHPGHERVVTGTNPRWSGLSPTIVAGSARTWPARPDATCSERGCARSVETTSDSAGNLRRSAPHLYTSFLGVAWNAVGAFPVPSLALEVPHATLSTFSISAPTSCGLGTIRKRRTLVTPQTERSPSDVAVSRRLPIPSRFLASARSS
jgi:hypothetical protein